MGVFAEKPFEPEDIVGRACGTVIDDPKHESDYCMELGHGLGLEPGPPFRYLNHSCRPNCILIQVETYDDNDNVIPGETEIWIEALSEIAPGEQLTIDYAWPAEVAIPCNCHSPNCRGWIVAEEQLHCLAERSGQLDGESDVKTTSLAGPHRCAAPSPAISQLG